MVLYEEIFKEEIYRDGALANRAQLDGPLATGNKINIDIHIQ